MNWKRSILIGVALAIWLALAALGIDFFERYASSSGIPGSRGDFPVAPVASLIDAPNRDATYLLLPRLASASIRQ